MYKNDFIFSDFSLQILRHHYLNTSYTKSHINLENSSPLNRSERAELTRAEDLDVIQNVTDSDNEENEIFEISSSKFWTQSISPSKYYIRVELFFESIN